MIQPNESMKMLGKSVKKTKPNINKRVTIKHC